MNGPNTPKRVMEIRKMMEVKFGAEVTKRSLSRMLSEEAFKKCYSEEKSKA